MNTQTATKIGFHPCCASYISDIQKEIEAFHEEIEIKCFYEGSATLLIGTQTVNVTKGDIVVINPYEFHATIDHEASKSHYHRFMVPLDFFLDNWVEELDLRSILLEKQKCFKTLFSNNLRLQRILLRGKDSGRADDASEDVIRNRIKIYNDQTAVVADYYLAQGKYEAVPSLGTIDEVFERICAVVEKKLQ